MQQKPQTKKPARKPTSTAYRKHPLEDGTAGKLYRVRCKDWENVWGENLRFREANQLKEEVATSGKSRTVRVEDMEVPAPDWYLSDEPAGSLPVATPQSPKPDPQLEAMRKKALAAAQVSAMTAQERHARHAARDRSSSGAAGKTAVKSPVLASVPDMDDDVAAAIGDDVGELDELMAGVGSDQLSEADLAHASMQRDQDAVAITARAKALYSAQAADGAPKWDDLDHVDRATWRFEAMNSTNHRPIEESQA